MKCIPIINWKYWMCLTFASVFGANMGDYLADGVNIGHLIGIPYLLGAIIILFALERNSTMTSALYFWVSIIIIRASGTNIGDIFHDLRLSFGYSVPLSVVMLIIPVLACWFIEAPNEKTSYINVNSHYWITMFFVSIFGTVGGDAMSYGVDLGNLGATLVLLIPLIIILFIGRKGLWTNLFYYWFTIAIIRCMGTAFGDFCAHKISLPLATIASGITFVVICWLVYRNCNNTHLKTKELDFNSQAIY